VTFVFTFCRQRDKSSTKTKSDKKTKAKPSKKSSKKKATTEDSDPSSSSRSSSSDSNSNSSSTSSPKRKRRKKKTNRKQKKISSSGSDVDSQLDDSSEGSASSADQTECSPGTAKKRAREKAQRRKRDKAKLKLMEETWPLENRPRQMQRPGVLKNMSLDEFLRVKKEIIGEEEKKNLGEEAFTRDGKARKTRYKKGSDDGKRKLHSARWNRQPLVPPEEFYRKIPKKRDTVIRNFPMEHLGIAGQVPDSVLGHMHNRCVKVSLDNFCKPTFKTAKGSEKAGKYADLFQLQEAIVNYCIVLHSLWPSDYSGLVLMKVLTEAKWGETAGLTGR